MEPAVGLLRGDFGGGWCVLIPLKFESGRRWFLVALAERVAKLAGSGRLGMRLH